jgi:hypothetical protein
MNSIDQNTKIVSNVLNYDDLRVNNLDILQQNSIKSIKKYFDDIENPKKPITEIDLMKSTKHTSDYSINSVGFFIKLFILVVFLVLVWDFVKTK